MAADFDFVHKEMVVNKLSQSVSIKFLSEASSLIQILPFSKMPNYPIKNKAFSPKDIWDTDLTNSC